MSFSDTFETRILQWALEPASSPTRPSAVYIALFNADPTDTGAGATELSGSGYSRKPVSFVVSGNTASNTAAVEFDVATAAWGTISHIGVYDAASAGNMIAHAALTTAKTIDANDVLRFPAGDIDVTLD